MLAGCKCALFFTDNCQGIHAESMKSNLSMPAGTRQAITACLLEQSALLRRLTPASKHAGQLRLIVLTLSSPLNTATTQERACRLDHRAGQQITFSHPRPALRPQKAQCHLTVPPRCAIRTLQNSAHVFPSGVKRLSANDGAAFQSADAIMPRTSPAAALSSAPRAPAPDQAHQHPLPGLR